jgi:hypothetical protein
MANLAPKTNLPSNLPAELLPRNDAEKEEAWIRYSPSHAPHVVGVFTRRRYSETNMPLEQRWKVVCTKCGKYFQGGCMTGALKAHIARFGGVHKACAEDPLKAPRVVRPGSLRRTRASYGE